MCVSVCLCVCLSVCLCVCVCVCVCVHACHLLTGGLVPQVDDFFRQARGLHEEMECQKALRGNVT